MLENEVFLKAYLQDRQKIVEEALEYYLPREDNIPADIYKAVRYSVFNGGKRRRQLAEIWGRQYRVPVLWN